DYSIRFFQSDAFRYDLSLLHGGSSPLILGPAMREDDGYNVSLFNFKTQIQFFGYSLIKQTQSEYSWNRIQLRDYAQNQYGIPGRGQKEDYCRCDGYCGY